MGKECWVFNPEHDMALADGKDSYMPPVVIRKMADDLALLPVWYADAPGYVLAASAYNLDYLNYLKDHFSLPLTLMTCSEIAEDNHLDIIPWGWDSSLVKQLCKNGMHADLLPSVEYLDTLRSLSHRACAIHVFNNLQKLSLLCGSPILLKTMKACEDFVKTQQFSVLKAPLSGSGKGLNWCKGEFTPLIEGWCKRVLSTQGGVVGEPVYDKVIDFAMEFSRKDDVTSFIGYSLFETSASGAYEGNSLQSDAMIENRLMEFIPIELLHGLRLELMNCIDVVFTAYNGYIGVDMMICRFDESPLYRLHPCVEINLRLNMGIVAHRIYESYISSFSKGYFKIVRHTSADEATKWHQGMMDKYPLQIRDGCVVSGYLALTPVMRHTQYIAAIWIEQLDSHCHTYL